MIKARYFLRWLFSDNLIIEFLVIMIPNRVIGETTIIIIFIVWEIDRSRIIILFFLAISK